MIESKGGFKAVIADNLALIKDQAPGTELLEQGI
jgi:hypothetical protein